MFLRDLGILIVLAWCLHTEGLRDEHSIDDVSRHSWSARQYQSPNGRYTLRVKPKSFPDGSNADYVFSDGDMELRSFAMSLTLQGAILTDQGDIMGVAYTELEPPKLDTTDPCSRDWNAPEGIFHVVALSPNGTEHLHEEYLQPPRRHFTNPPSPLRPHALKLFQLEEHSLAILWTREASFAHRVLVYDLERWKLRGTYRTRPGQSGVQEVMQIKPHALVLVHESEGDSSASFKIIDSSASVVWTLELPDDYVDFVPRQNPVPKRGQQVIKLGQHIKQHPQVQMLDKPGCFAICSAKTKECTEYSLQSAELPIRIVQGGKFPFNWDK